MSQAFKQMLDDSDFDPDVWIRKWNKIRTAFFITLRLNREWERGEGAFRLKKIFSRKPTQCHKCKQVAYVGSGTCLNEKCVQALVAFVHHALQGMSCVT